MNNALLNQLQLYTSTSSLENIFATPTLSFKIFCPILHANLQEKSSSYENTLKRNNSDRNQDRGQEKNTASKHFDKDQDNGKRQKTETRGSIMNKTGKRIFSPQGLDKKYCSDFLDAGETCPRGDNCHFVHAVYRGGFTANYKPLVEKFIKDEPGLSFNPNCNKNLNTLGFGQ